MTNSDRLREAAEVLDKRNYFLGDDPDPEWATTAALLRAVAVERRPMPTRVVAAALALADTILGGGDE